LKVGGPIFGIIISKGRTIVLIRKFPSGGLSYGTSPVISTVHLISGTIFLVVAQTSTYPPFVKIKFPAVKKFGKGSPL